MNKNTEFLDSDKAIIAKNLLGAIDQTLVIKPEKTKAKPMMTGMELMHFAPEKMPTLVDPLLPQSGLACLAGGSDTGKSCALRQLAICTVLGKPWVGFNITPKHYSAIYGSTEDDASATSFLLNRQALGMGCVADDLKRLRFIFEWDGQLVDELDKMLTAQPADIVIIDAFSDAFGGDLKDTAKIRNFLHPYQQLINKHNCLILFLHHTGKRTEEREPSKNNLLSGQGLEAKMRMVMELRVDQSDPQCRHLCIVKGNYLAASFKQESYVLRFDPDNFTFSNTDDRTPFELLSKQSDDGGKSKYEIAKKHKDNGMTLAQIAEKMGFANAGGVSKLLSRHEGK